MKAIPTQAINTPYTTVEDILSNALISDDPKIMQLDKLPPETLAYIVSGRLQGYLPVSVRWVNGPFALMFCEPGTNMPNPQKIIHAYRHSQFTMNDSPDGGSL